MCSRYVEYNRKDSSEARRAIVDLIQYIGIKRAKILFRTVRQRQTRSLDAFGFLCGMAGVQGWPVEALWRYLTYQPLDAIETKFEV